MTNDINAYLDTSVLAAYYCPEPLSDMVEKIILGLPQPAISSLTELELSSAISRKIREGHLSSVDGKKIVGLFHAHLQQLLFRRIALQPQHYQIAKEWMGQFNTALRTLDALHLAVASTENLVLITADHALSASAKTLGIEVLLLTLPFPT